MTRYSGREKINEAGPYTGIRSNSSFMITASAAILSHPEPGQCKIIGEDKDIDTLMNESATADGMHQLHSSL